MRFKYYYAQLTDETVRHRETKYMPKTTELTHAFPLPQADSRPLFKLAICTEQNVTSGLEMLPVIPVALVVPDYSASSPNRNTH